MPVSPGFLEYVQDLFDGLGSIEIKRMFGAAGAMCDGAMFAVIDDDVIYLKADDTFAEELQAMGATRWVYSHRSAASNRVSNNWSLPDEAADDRELARELALRAIGIARAGKAKKGKRRSRGRA